MFKACVEGGKPGGRISGGVGHGGDEQIEGGGARQDDAGPGGGVDVVAAHGARPLLGSARGHF